MNIEEIRKNAPQGATHYKDVSLFNNNLAVFNGCTVNCFYLKKEHERHWSIWVNEKKYWHIIKLTWVEKITNLYFLRIKPLF